MPAIGYAYNFLRGLSDFWQRFFADAHQLEALYQGTAVQIGQAYLDLMSATLGVSLKDAITLDREHYHMLALREDEVRYVKGAGSVVDRWAYTLPDPVVYFSSIDNRVIEPTASLEPQIDYDIDLKQRVVYFRVDPTDPTGNGLPLDGYARRSLDVAVGGSFTDTAVTAWITATDVQKGDTLRILDIGTDGAQQRRTDHSIVLVRDTAFYVAATTPLPAPTTGVTYVVVRTPYDPVVTAEAFTPAGVAPYAAQLVRNRLDRGFVRVYAKRLSDGMDVVENVDYTINYEGGVIYRVTPWEGVGPYAVDYTWRQEVYPGTGAAPRRSLTGKVIATTTTRVLQMAAWTPETLVDRRTLSNNFGALIGREQNSTEAYRAFLEGIFQLYILGPVLERIESALNVVLNLPVVRDDGELYQSTDTTDITFDRITTLRPSTRQRVTYEFPKGTPLRTDLVFGQTLLSFETLTTAVAVTDYVQTPNWWHGETVPEQLFTPVNGVLPAIYRRVASPFYVENIVGAVDAPEVGDPGLLVGADEAGFIPPPGQPVFRHRMAFVLMDRYLKFHTFSVKFDAAALSLAAGAAFAQGLKDLNELVLTAKPAHTYAFTTPTTVFRDVIDVTDVDISFARLLGSRVYGPDKVVFTDGPPVVGAGIWNVGDYFKYEMYSALTAFPVIATPVTLTNTPAAPRVGRLVMARVVGSSLGGTALVENVDYTVDYTLRRVTRLTAWTATTVYVFWTQLSIGNPVNAPIGVADMPVLVNGVDPAHITGAFDATAAGWDGVTTPLTAPRDIGLVERALIVYAHA
jgi:hypothetical protein